MAGISKLILWVEAAEMAADAILASRKTAGPGAAKAADQFRRAAESVPHNIAEGHGRGVS